MAEKRINGRIVLKHDVESNWQLATGFTPMAGEIIVYDIDENYDYERIKIGDGVQNVNDLPFYAGSWEDLADRPFWSEGPTTVYWNENIEEISTSGSVFYKISTEVPEPDEILGSVFTLSNGAQTTVTSDVVTVHDSTLTELYYGCIYIVSSSSETAINTWPTLGLSFPGRGIYFIKNTVNQIVSFSYGEETIYTLDEKYIPNTIARVTDIPEQTIIDDALSGTSTNPVQNKVVNEAFNNLNALVGDTSVSEQINSAISSFTFDCIKMRDKTNGYNYLLEFINGQFVSSCCTTDITVTTLPSKTTYVEGESLDTSGMVVTAICEDGSVKNIENYDTSIESGTGSRTASVIYTECGTTYIATFTVTVTSIEEALIDFEYTAEEDGTYTITGWKGTLNGEESTECVIPDNPLINV